MTELTIIEGDKYILQGELEIDGLYYTPESGTLSVRITDLYGLEVLAHQANLSYPFTIDAGSFTLPEGMTTKHLRMRISFEVEGMVINKRYLFKVTKELPLTFNSEDVISTLGASDELSDSEVDIYYAYDQVLEKVGPTFMTIPANLNTDNRLVFIKTLLNLLPTYSLKILQVKKVDDHSETRFKIDLVGLKNSLLAEFNTILSLKYDLSYEAEQILEVVSRVDAYTGTN